MSSLDISMNHYSENDILVSVVTLTYNHRNFIRQCIEGILMQQTRFKFELLIHDDASTDGTAQIIREYEITYPDIVKPIYQTENQYSKGVRIGSQYLYPKAQGKYIAECEGDDYWVDPLKLQKQVDYLESNPECGLCYTNYSIKNEHNNTIIGPIFSNNTVKPLTFEDHLLTRGYIAPMTWLARKDLMVSFARDCASFSDGTFAIALEFLIHSRIDYLNYNTAVYRFVINSATHRIDPKDHFHYDYGVYQTQLHYAKKYHREDLIPAIRFDALFYIYPYAFQIKDKELIHDFNSFFNSKGLRLSSYNELLTESQKTQAELNRIQHSRGYRFMAFVRSLTKHNKLNNKRNK